MRVAVADAHTHCCTDQGRQAWPLTSFEEPAGHGVHVLPSASEPFSHWTQRLWSSLGTDPAPQDSQAAEPVRAYVPAAQRSHSFAPSALHVPAGQAVHEMLADALLLYVPALHGKASAWPVVDVKVPSMAGTQVVEPVSDW